MAFERFAAVCLSQKAIRSRTRAPLLLGLQIFVLLGRPPKLSWRRLVQQFSYLSPRYRINRLMPTTIFSILNSAPKKIDQLVMLIRSSLSYRCLA